MVGSAGRAQGLGGVGAQLQLARMQAWGGGVREGVKGGSTGREGGGVMCKGGG